MAERTAAQKMRLKPGMTVALLNAPSGLAEGLGAPEGVVWTDSATGSDAILLFVSSQAEFEGLLEALMPQLAPASILWVCYPKGSKSAGLDISRDTIWPHAESHGMRPVGMVSVDEKWSGFRLRIAS